MKRARLLICPGDHARVREQYVAALRVALEQEEARLNPEQTAQWAVLRPAIEHSWRVHPHPRDGTDRSGLAAAVAILPALVRGMPFERLCKYAIGREWEPLCERVSLAEPPASAAALLEQLAERKAIVQEGT